MLFSKSHRSNIQSKGAHVKNLSVLEINATVVREHSVLFCKIMLSSLAWPDLSLVQGIIAFIISTCTKKSLEQFIDQNGSITPQKSWDDNLAVHITLAMC